MTRTITIPHTDKLGSLFLIALSTAVFVLSEGLPAGRTAGDPGPAFFPRLIVGGISLLAIIQFIKLTATGTNVRHEVSVDTAMRVTVVLTLLTMYVLLLPILGFLLGSFFFLAILFRYSGVTTPSFIVIVSFGLPLILFYVFSGIFNIPLPENAIVPISRLLPLFVLLLDPIIPSMVEVPWNA